MTKGDGEQNQYRTGAAVFRNGTGAIRRRSLSARLEVVSQLFKGQMVRILTDAETDVAVLAQSCEIHGTIQGKLYFRGQILTIKPGAKVLGGIDVQTQVLQNQRDVTGEITGKYQSTTIPTRTTKTSK